MRRVIMLTLALSALVVPSAAGASDVDAGEVDMENVTAGEVEVEVEVTSSAGSDPSEGCRTVDIARTQRTMLGAIAFRFHQVKKWCWKYPRITSRAIWTYVDKVDPMMDYQGVVGSVGYYYNWLTGISASGHYSFRQGKFENCLIWFSCIGTYYAWVKIWARANGSYSYATGS